MPLTGYQTTRFYDAANDRDSIRIDGFSGRGVYFVTRALVPPGKSRRAQLDEALDLIEDAIDAGAAPGEVNGVFGKTGEWR